MSLDHLRPYLEHEGLCPDPVFIIGSPRSGTTALAHALGRHPELWVSKESYFLHQLYGNGRVEQVWEHNWRRATPSWLRAETVERAEFFGFLGLAVNALYSSRSQGRRWVEQTPLYTLMVNELAEMFPTASFLHIVRDGRSVVRSMGGFRAMFGAAKRAVLTDEVPEWANDFQLACTTWADWVDTALRFTTQHPERCLTFSNEELAARPQAGFSRIFEFLALPSSPEPALAFEGPRVNSSFRRARSRPPEGDWNDWPLERRRVFVELAGDTLVRAGYSNPTDLAAWASGEAGRQTQPEATTTRGFRPSGTSTSMSP
jgi:Sulfotransferase family